MKVDRKKTSIIWTLSDDNMTKIVESSTTIKEILNKLGFKSISGNGSYKTLKLRLERSGICYSHIPTGLNCNKGRSLRSYTKLSMCDILVEHSTYNRGNLKRRLITDGLLNYKCNKCGNVGKHEGETLTLQLDHINGVHDDNRIENLQFLCPNCHSQTKTFCGRHKKIQRNHCVDCGNVICKKSLRCRSCAGKVRRCSSVTTSDIEHIKAVLISNGGNVVKSAKEFGISDNGLRKRCRSLKINWKDYKMDRNA